MSTNFTTLTAPTLLSTNADLVEINQQSVLNQITAPTIGQKSIIYQQSTFLSGSDISATSIYDRTVRFPIWFKDQGYKQLMNTDKTQTYLAKVDIEITLTMTYSQTTCQPRLASRIFKNIRLETFRGPSNVYQDIKPQYTNYILDEINADDNYLLDPPSTFTTGTVTIICPVFFQFGNSFRQGTEVMSKFPPISQIEPLQITAITSGSKTDMGLTADPTDWRFRSIYTMYQLFCEPVPLPRSLLITDVYYENSIALGNSVSTYTLPITCTYPSFAMGIIIKDTNQNYLKVNSFTMYQDQKIVTAWTNYGPTYTSMQYFFQGQQTRFLNTIGTLNMNDIMSPSLTVNFTTTTSANFTLYVFFEYYDQLYHSEDSYLQRVINF